MYEKVPSETVFKEVAEYFLRTKKDIKEVSINQVPDNHPFTRILRVCLVSGEEEKFVIKILKDEQWTADKSVADILHEIAIKKELKQLGFTTRDYLLLENGTNNPIGIPFSVSTYLEGTPLSTMSVREIAALIPKVLDVLYSLHSKTISSSFGYSLDPKERYSGKGSTLFGDFESKYLLADIKRYNIEFDEQEKKDLIQAINFLNETDQFSLCHCDVTLSNIIWGDSNIYLIDWTYSHFTEPVYDIAYLIFWLLEFKFFDQAREEIKRAFKRYQQLGFDIAPRFLFYLAQKYIEFGRFRGSNYINQGKQLLKRIPTNSVEELLKIIENIVKRTKRSAL